MKLKLFFVKKLILTLFAVLFLNALVCAQELYVKHAIFLEGDYHPNGDTTGVSDVWGWRSEDGTEYALVGVKEGTAIVRTSDGMLIDVVPGATQSDYYYHRDIKTYGHYAYVVQEMLGLNEGVQVIDLSFLPDSAHLVQNYIHADKIRSHNLSIDTATGFAYVVDHSYNGVRIIDITEPENPVETGFITAAATHDVYARNDTAWVAEGYSQSFSIWDVSDKTDPQLLVRLEDSTFGYCHSIWPTEDGRHFVTTEETKDKTVKIWSLDDTSGVSFVSEYLAECGLAHNAQVLGDSLYISHYQSGVVVVDISDRSNPVEVRGYDTYYQELSGFYGCWGVYQYAKSKDIYATSFEGWLHILSFEEVVLNRSAFATGLDGFSAFPNPFGHEIVFEWNVSSEEVKGFRVFDILGNEVKAEIQTERHPETVRILWDGCDANGKEVASGIYFAELKTNGGLYHRQIRKQ